MNEEEYELSLQTAHPAASALLTEDFFWDASEETSPFGNDDGADAFYGFREWRSDNQTASPFIYINELLDSWGYNEAPKQEEAEVAEYLINRFALGVNNVIIAVGFGQFVLEGTIDKELLIKTKQAIEKECEPAMLNAFVEDYRKTRLAHLHILLNAVDKIAAL
ncbi:hypothetical protein GFS24_09855 [Chitinophaga sp. SYP-B3965]|uniref:hypothetical protein n=1 Tax=Chitinophaga sp. SYP-B3965 TaxID=2663120 RepID=UPI00129987B4|nr:hypothetical protein [Chitinophaga sp. SYP-B3965]MRG45420.1 hypothetical protein [Chitinophaga sp. SYP-B3965]